MISMTELITLWNNIAPVYGQNVGRRADDTHPLDFFITFDEESKMQLVLVSRYIFDIPESSEQLFIRVNSRQDGKYALCFSLKDLEFRNQFMVLCWDIMNSTYDIADEKQATSVAIERFCMWQELFAVAKNKKLSDAQIKGLIGELYVLKNIIIPKYGAEVAITSWCGPIGADRDFELTDSWYEVKAISLSKDFITISSIDQLDMDIEGKVTVVRLEKMSENNNESFTLNSLIDEIGNDLTDLDVRMIFYSKLIGANYDHSDERLDVPYIVYDIELYKVDDSFPKIVRSKLPVEISNGTYNLSISGIQRWKVN